MKKYLTRERIICIFLAALTIGVFAQTYRQELVPFDDGIYVGQNPHVRTGLTWSGIAWAFTTSTAANWHPLTWLSHMIDFQLFGDNFGAHHLVNVAFHVVNVLLVFLLFRRMTGVLWPSAFVAAVFAIHPLHVESVAWIAERKDVLSTFFWLTTMAAYVHYVGKPSVRRYLLVVFSFALGLMAKPMLVTLPCVLLLLDYWPLRRIEGHVRRAVLEKAPLAAITALSCVVTYFAQRGVGAVQTLDMVSFWERAGNALVAYTRYIFHAVWPVGLSTFYPLPAGGVPLWQGLLAGVAVTGISLVVFLQRKQQPWLVTGWLWFAGTLVPVIGLVQVGEQALADRYMYVPLIGLAVMAAWSLPAMAKGVRATRAVGVAGGFAVAALTVLCAVQTWYWGDNVRLYRHETKLQPTSSFAFYQLGLALKKAGCRAEAEQAFRETLAMEPKYVDANLQMGLLHHERKEYEKAIEYYERALARASGSLNRAGGEINIGAALCALGKFDEAAKHYEIALSLEPGNATAHFNLANIFASRKQIGEAEEHYRAAIQLNPQFTDARKALNALAASATPPAPEEKPTLETAADYFKYGNQLADLGQYAQAAGNYEAALRLNPSLGQARINLGNTFGVRGKHREALEQYNIVLQENPNDTCALANAGNALYELGHYSRARDAFNTALQVNPSEAEAYGVRKSLQRLLEVD